MAQADLSVIVNVEMPIIENLAELCHEQWANWMEYLFKFGVHSDNGTFTMNADKVSRWQRQMETTYQELSEKEKESDRVEARKFLLIFAGGKVE